jgi:hypothetical protein
MVKNKWKFTFRSTEECIKFVIPNQEFWQKHKMFIYQLLHSYLKPLGPVQMWHRNWSITLFSAVTEGSETSVHI